MRMYHAWLREIGIPGVLANFVACLSLPVVVIGFIDSDAPVQGGVFGSALGTMAILFIVGMNIRAWRAVRRRAREDRS